MPVADAPELDLIHVVDLLRLARALRALESDHETVYCFFNNTSMFANARRLMELL